MNLPPVVTYSRLQLEIISNVKDPLYTARFEKALCSILAETIICTVFSKTPLAPLKFIARIEYPFEPHYQRGEQSEYSTTNLEHL